MTPATSTPALTGAASTLLAGLVNRRGLRLVEVARTPLAVHYETGVPGIPVLCVALPAAVRLPNSLITRSLPPPGDLEGVTWRVTRWWRPDRPMGLVAPPATRLAALPPPSYADLDPVSLLGRGPGLTPEGDDVLAGALVTGHATADPRLARWQSQTREALATRRTTAVSRGLLHHALDGYAVPQLAGLLTGLCRGGDLSSPVARLRAVGHSSGAALLAGVVLTLSTRTRSLTHEGAA